MTKEMERSKCDVWAQVLTQACSHVRLSFNTRIARTDSWLHTQFTPGLRSVLESGRGAERARTIPFLNLLSSQLFGLLQSFLCNLKILQIHVLCTKWPLKCVLGVAHMTVVAHRGQRRCQIPLELSYRYRWCEPPDMGSVNQTWVLYKSSKYS